MIRIVAIGNKHEDWITIGLERYQKRLRQPFNTDWQLLPHSSLAETQARREESERILRKLRDDDIVVLLDERGRQWTSPAFAAHLESIFAQGGTIVLVIGGAYGVNDVLYKRADIVWSLGKLVYPHQLVRLILIEQIYRAQEIARGSSYHHI